MTYTRTISPDVTLASEDHYEPFLFLVDALY